MSVEVPVAAGKDLVNINISFISNSTINQRVIIKNSSGSFSQTVTGSGTETKFDLPRTRDEKYTVHIDHTAGGKDEWTPSRVDINHPQLSEHIGTYYVLGYDSSNTEEPNVAVVFTWLIE
eukprot:Phypoly_transcript_20944.p1 GENE.Phypoly_transcript_20944~~Phypoly_transcript_20944.p1  ORF type:complete len:120 (+),score=13.18 Phypoly_transcript_20944:88-447(+)